MLSLPRRSFLGVLADMSELHPTASLRFPPNENRLIVFTEHF
jgi:hypothetical protein